jgi:small subunit ribosomal protein S36
VWSIVALHLTLLLFYSVVMPTYRAPDEPQHVDLAHEFSEELRYPAWDARDTGVGVLNSLNIVRFHQQSKDLESAAAPHKDDRPSIDELDEQTRPRAINQLSQHPPLYYAVSGLFVRGIEVFTGDPIGAFDVEAWFYRLASILMVGSLPLIVWTTGRRFGLPDNVAIAATLVPLAIPEYLHIGSSANNDTLLILFFWLLTPLVLRLARGDLSVKTAVLAGLVTGGGLYTKGFALMMPGWVLGALLLALARGGRSQLGRIASAGAVYGVVALATGGWWWVANLVRYGRLLPNRMGDLVDPIESNVRDMGEFVRTWGSITTRRFWGDFGRFDVHIPSLAVALATGVVLLALVAACVGRDRIARSPVGDRLLLAAPLILLIVFQFIAAWRAYLDLGRMPGLQGRYWFGALAALSVIVALGLARVLGRFARWLPLALLGGVWVMNLVATRAIVGFYWGAPGSGWWSRLRAVVAWAPFQGEVLATGAVVGLMVCAVATALIVATTLDHETDTPPSDVGPPHRTARNAYATAP